MATRKIIDAKHNGEKVWLKSHAQATFMSDGATVEDTIKSMQTGSGGITSESDPIFSASPAFNITDENIENWNGKQDAISDLDEIRSGAGKGATAVQSSTLASVATSGSYNDLSDKPTIPNRLGQLTNDKGFVTTNDIKASVWECPLEGEIGDILEETDDQDRIELLSEWIGELSNQRPCLLMYDEPYGYAFVQNYKSHPTYGSGMCRFSYIYNGYIYEVEYDNVMLPVTLTIVNKAKVESGGEGNADPMICAYTIGSYTARTIELVNHTYNGQTMDYREGAIISVLNPNSTDIVFVGGTVTLDGNAYEAEAFTIKSGATALFALGPDPGVLLPISSVVGTTTVNNKLPLEDIAITLEGNVLSGNVYVIPNTISSLSVGIAEPTDGVLVKDYIIHFFTGASVSSFSFPDELLWANGNVPTIEESTAYELSVVATSIGGGYVYKGVLTVFK